MSLLQLVTGELVEGLDDATVPRLELQLLHLARGRGGVTVGAAAAPAQG